MIKIIGSLVTKNIKHLSLSQESAKRLFLILGLFMILFTNVLHAQPTNIDDLLQNMTLEHKVGQMFMVSLFGPQLTEVGQEFLETWQPGAVVLFENNISTPEAITRLTNAYQQTMIDAGGMPLFIAVDQEGGKIAHLKEGFTTFPAPMLLAATADSDLAYEVGGSTCRRVDGGGR